MPVNALEPFTSSIDWGNAFVDSMIWIVRAWAIAAVCVLSVLAVIARFTMWGRQFWNVTGAYFTGPHSVKPWASLELPRREPIRERHPVCARRDESIRQPCWVRRLICSTADPSCGCRLAGSARYLAGPALVKGFDTGEGPYRSGGQTRNRRGEVRSLGELSDTLPGDTEQ